MSTENKKIKSGKVPANIEKKAPVKEVRSRRRVPSASVLATFDDLLDDFRRSFRESFWTPWEWVIEPFQPYEVEFPVRATYSDLIDEGNKFLVRAEIPGVPKNKIDVTITKYGIEISGEADEEKEEKKKNYIVRERSCSRIYKSIAFPEEVIPEKAESSLKDGVLEVSVPKKTSTPEVKKHKVEVKEAK